jgi:hypothetical protein
MASRVNFKTILNQYKLKGKDNVRLTQSTLYLSKAINTAATNYNFDVLETQNATLASNEIRLNQNDEFIITSLGVFVEMTFRDETNTTNYGTRLLPYAPAEIKSTFAGLNALWNGSLQISVNNIVYLDKWDTAKCQVIPETQFNPFTAATAAITATNANQGAFDYSKAGMQDIEPMIVLSGAKKTTISLTLPSALTAPDSNIVVDSGTIKLTAARIVLIARGLNAQNGASFQA